MAEHEKATAMSKSVMKRLSAQGALAQHAHVAALVEAARAVLPYIDLMWPPEDATGQRVRLQAALRAALKPFGEFK